MIYTDKNSFTGINHYSFWILRDIVKTICAAVLFISINKPWGYLLAIILNADAIRTAVHLVSFYWKAIKATKDLHIKIRDLDRYLGMGLYLINTEELNERVKEFESQEKHAS